MKTSGNSFKQPIGKKAYQRNRLSFPFFTLIILSGTFLFFNVNSLFAQAPDTLWTKTFGGVQADDGYCVQQTTDGGFIITGLTYSASGGSDPDVYLIKTNDAGDTLWTKTYGTKNKVDEGRYVQQTSDGGFIVTGSVFAQGKGLQVWLIKTDANGDSLWSKEFGGQNNEMGYCVQQTSDGGYILTGELQASGNLTDLWLIKTDGNGNYLWSKNYGGTGYDKGYSVEQTTDGGYIVTGYTASFGAGYNDVWLLKTDAAGDTLWTRTYGGFDNDYGYCVQQTTDGGYFITGTSHSFSAGTGVYLVKTDAAGDTLWTKSFSGSRGYSGRQTSDGGYIVTGWAEPLGPANSNIWLIRTNPSGDTLWTKVFGADEYEQGRSVQQTSDGGYVLCGFTDSYGAGGYDIWLIRVDAETTTIQEKQQTGFAIYPNPTSGKFNITGLEPGVKINRMEIIDSFGQITRSFGGEFFTEGKNIDVSNLAAGLYFCRIYLENKISTKELIIHQ